jgi:hypothetical protein
MTTRPPSTRFEAPPASELQTDVVTILNTCIKRSFDSTVSLGPVTQATNSLITLSREYSLDAPLAPSQLKAHTLRAALANAADVLQKCSPTDYANVQSALGPS